MLLKFSVGVLEFQLIAKEKKQINGYSEMVYLLLAWQKNRIGNVQNQVRIVNEELLNLMYPFIQLLIHSA